MPVSMLLFEDPNTVFCVGKRQYCEWVIGYEEITTLGYFEQFPRIA